MRMSDLIEYGVDIIDYKRVKTPEHGLGWAYVCDELTTEQVEKVSKWKNTTVTPTKPQTYKGYRIAGYYNIVLVYDKQKTGK